MTGNLTDFFKQHSIGVGDHVRVHWKNQTLDGLILPQPQNESHILTLKLSSGYNTGLALSNIQKVEKLEALSVPKKNNPTVVSSHPSDKPAFSVIGVGGTIASKVDYDQGGVTAKMTPEELTLMVPEIAAFAQIRRIISPFTKMSEDIDPQDWIELARVCHEEINKPDTQGVIITHGTDTLHYTAAALSFMLPELAKPVILVGSQRSSDRGSSDATMNLICAAHLAISKIAEVGICMHGSTSDDYCLFTRGTAVRKMHSSRRDAFRPINQQAIAKVWPDGKIEPIGESKERSSGPTKLNAVFEENIALVKVYPGITPDLFDFYVNKGCKGFVIEGTGLGHVNTKHILPAVAKITAKGIPVFISTQTIYGRVNLNVYTNLRLLQSAGAIGLEDMMSETAYVKLGWILGHVKDVSKVKEMMLTNYAGELTTFTPTGAFLN